MGIDGGVIDLRPRFGHHDSSDPLAPVRVRQADDGGLEDIFHLIDNPFDFGRGDVFAARDNHVFLAVREEQKSVFVEMADIAAPEPAFRMKGGRVFSRSRQ